MSRLLYEGKAHLPEEYPTPTGMIVDEIRLQSTPLSGRSSPTKPGLLPKPDDDADHSGDRSSGPTPAPTPDTERVARDISDDGSVTSDPLDSGGDGFDDIGGETQKNRNAVANSALKRESCDDEVKQQTPLTTAVSAPAVSASPRAGTRFQWREDEKEEEEEKEEVSGGEEDEGRRGRETEVGQSGQAYGGARDGAEGGPREEAGSPSPSGGAELDTNGREPREALEREDGGFDEHRETDSGSEDGGRRRRNDSEVDPLPSSLTSKTSPAAAVTATATATVASAIDREAGSENDPEDTRLRGESTNARQREEKEAQEEEEQAAEEVSSVEEEDDDFPEDVESEEYYEAGRGATSRGGSKGEEGKEEGADHGDGDGELRSEGGGVSNSGSNGVDDDAENAVDPVAFGGDVGMIAVDRARSAEHKDDRVDSARGSPRATDREAGDLDTVTPPPVASASPPPKPTSPTAAETTATLRGAGEGGTTPQLLASPPSPPRDLASMPSSPPGEARTGSSSLAGLPLPPMAGARQRLGLLGSLPPVGGRGLPSLALPVGKQTSSASGEDGGGLSRAGRGEARDGTKDVLSAAEPFTAAESGPASVSEPLRLSHSPNTSEEDGAKTDSVDHDGANHDAGSDAHHFARSSPTGGGEAVEGEGGVGEQDEKEEEAALRARLGLGEDFDDDEEDEEDEDDEEDGGAGGTEKNTTSSAPGSPKQHQGQEEENAGRTSPAVEGGDAPTGGGGGGGGGSGGDYFGDLNEVDVLGGDSSVDEDISFEEESVESDGGDDYFS